MLKAKKVSTLGLIITAIIVAEALIFMPSSSIKESNPSQTVLPASDANLSIEGFHAVNLNQEGRKETIDAEEAELYREKGFALLKKVEARIFGQGDDVIHIKGQEGKYYLDKKDIEFGISHQIDIIALSFVKTAKDILDLRFVIKELEKKLLETKTKVMPVQIIAKIERNQAVKNIKEIIEVADGVMVARGDLG